MTQQMNPPPLPPLLPFLLALGLWQSTEQGCFFDVVVVLLSAAMRVCLMADEVESIGGEEHRKSSEGLFSLLLPPSERTVSLSSGNLAPRGG